MKKRSVSGRSGDVGGCPPSSGPHRRQRCDKMNGPIKAFLLAFIGLVFGTEMRRAAPYRLFNRLPCLEKGLLRAFCGFEGGLVIRMIGDFFHVFHVGDVVVAVHDENGAGEQAQTFDDDAVGFAER